MLINARAADGPVDNKDGHLLTGHKSFGQFHAPVTKFRLVLGPGLPDRVAPQVRPRGVGILRRGPRRPAVTADPFACVTRGLLAGIGSQGVRLSFDEISIAAHQVGGRVQHLLLPFASRAELHPVLDQSRFEFHCKGIGPVGWKLLSLGLEDLVIRIDFQKHSIRRLVERAVVVKRALVLIIAGVELVVLGFLVLFRNPLHPRIGPGLGHADLDRGPGRRAAVIDLYLDVDRAGILRPFKDQPIGGNVLDHGSPGNSPVVMQCAAPGPSSLRDCRSRAQPRWFHGRSMSAALGP